MEWLPLIRGMQRPPGFSGKNYSGLGNRNGNSGLGLSRRSSIYRCVH